ncbi:unnamed protein product [Calypogeia fissa]
MGSVKKASSEKKKKEVAVSAGKANPQGVESGKATKENEIDAIFGKKKRRNATETVAEDDEGMIQSRPSSQKKKKVKKMAPSVGGEDGKQSRGGGTARKSSSSSASAESGLSKPRKKTTDGLTIYAEDELKWNNKDAGGTPLCPFDCECCF